MVQLVGIKKALRELMSCLVLCVISHAIIHQAEHFVSTAQAGEARPALPGVVPPNFCVSVEVRVGRKLLLKHWNGQIEWMEIPTEVCYACPDGKHFCEDRPGLVAERPKLRDK